MHIACVGIYPSACVLTRRRAFREPVPWLSRSSMLRATTKSGKAKSEASQLARASPLQGEGRGFKSLNAHQGEFVSRRFGGVGALVKYLQPMAGAMVLAAKKVLAIWSRSRSKGLGDP